MGNRKNVSCSSCGKEWEIKEEDYKELKACPFCVSEYIFPEETIVVDSFPNAILKVISSFGIGVLSERSRFLSCLLDFAPEYKKEVKIVSRVCTQDTFSEMVRWSSINEAGQTASIARLKTLFVEEEGLSDEWADKIIEGFSYAIIPSRRQKSRKPVIEQTQESKTVVHKTQEYTQSNAAPVSVGETGNVYILFISPTDPKCVMAKKYLDDAGISYKSIDVERYPAVASRYSIRQTPVLVVYKNGIEENRPQGVENIRKYLSSRNWTSDQTPSPKEPGPPTVKVAPNPYTHIVSDTTLNTVLNCPNVCELVWDKKLKVPANETFKGNSDIEFIIINGRRVEKNMFENCSNLKAIYIASCSEIDWNAFSNCKALKYVILSRDANPSVRAYAFDCCPNAVFYYDSDSGKGRYACESMARSPKQVSSFSSYTLKNRHLWSRSDYNKYSVISGIVEFAEDRIRTR